MARANPTDWEYALKCARGHSMDYSDALVQVLDTAWAVNAYLQEKGLPSDGATVTNLTAQVLAREERLNQKRVVPNG